MSSISHELVETVTDPGIKPDIGLQILHPNGHNLEPFYSATADVEISDVCITGHEAMVNGVNTQAYFSNIDNSCVNPTTEYAAPTGTPGPAPGPAPVPGGSKRSIWYKENICYKGCRSGMVCIFYW